MPKLRHINQQIFDRIFTPRPGRFGFAVYSPKCDVHSNRTGSLKKDMKPNNFLKLNGSEFSTETFNCTIWILVLLYIGERSWEKIASDKKYAEIRRNTQKHPIKDPYQRPQAKTLAPTVPSHRRLG